MENITVPQDKLDYDPPFLMFLDLGNANIVAGGSPGKVNEEGAPDDVNGDDFSGGLG